VKTIRHSSATLELLLIFPAVLFMTALFVRSVQPPQYEPAHTALRIVDWYAARTYVGLWLLLIALPIVVLVIGASLSCGTGAASRPCAKPRGQHSQRCGAISRCFLQLPQHSSRAAFWLSSRCTCLQMSELSGVPRSQFFPDCVLKPGFCDVGNQPGT